MPLAVETLLFSPGGMVTLNALKRSGRSVTVGNFVAETTVRAIGWAGGCCATAWPLTSTARVKAEVIAKKSRLVDAVLEALPARADAPGVRDTRSIESRVFEEAYEIVGDTGSFDQDTDLTV